MRTILIFVALASSPAHAAPKKCDAACWARLGKCTAPNQICALTNGGRCNTKTGAWGVGTFNGTQIGGSVDGWQACIDRFHARGRLNGNGKS